jgi:PAS domain S-box-containing protein
LFWRHKKSAKQSSEQDERLDESQRILLDAATATANAAQAVTQRIQDHLADSMRSFEGTAKIMSDALIVCEMDGQVRSCNPAAGRLFGRSDLLDLNITELFERDGKPIADAVTLWNLIEHSSAWLPRDPAPLQGRRVDGRLIWIEPSITRLDWSDRTSSMLLIVRNIDPVVGLSQSARTARQRYQSVFEGSPDGILIEQQGQIVAANKALNRMLGYAPGVLIGNTLDILFPGEDYSRGAPSPEHSHFPIIGRKRDGFQIPLAFTATAIVWNDAAARLITLKDANAMRRIEETVTQRDNGIDRVVVFGRDFRVTFANRTFAISHDLDERAVLNRDIRDLLSDEERAALLTSIATLTPETRSCRMQVPSQDGTSISDWIDHAVFDARGEAVEYQRVGRDLSLTVATLVTATNG